MGARDLKSNQQAYLDVVAETAAKVATEKAIEIYRSKMDEEEQKFKDRRLRNTKILLKNFHNLKAYAEKERNKAFEREGITEDTAMKDVLVLGEDIVKSIKATTQRTISMVEYIERSLQAFEYICKNSPNPKETQRQYDVLKMRFLEQKSIEEIAVEMRINERSVYKAIDSAAERLSIILFGVYGIKFDN